MKSVILILLFALIAAAMGQYIRHYGAFSPSYYGGYGYGGLYRPSIYGGYGAYRYY